MRLSVFALCLALLAAACGGASSPSGPSPSNPGTAPGGLVTVLIQNFAYSPNPVRVKVGQQVNWLNRDNVTHTATREGMFDNEVFAMSAHGAPVTMTTAGSFSYHCKIHPGMTGTIVVEP